LGVGSLKQMELAEVIADVVDALLEIDRSGQPFRNFQPGVGPYGEPQLVKLVASSLNALSKYHGQVRTKRNPDLLIPNKWAMEFKIVRPFGDNGKEAENWSVNLLHPYPGNVSVVGDCYKLARYQGSERRAAVVIGYEHLPSRIDISPLIRSFEAIIANVCGMKLSDRVETRRDTLIHPVHQSLRVFAWEVINRIVQD
jgi:hypothetical protein